MAQKKDESTSLGQFWKTAGIVGLAGPLGAALIAGIFAVVVYQRGQVTVGGLTVQKNSPGLAAPAATGGPTSTPTASSTEPACVADLLNGIRAENVGQLPIHAINDDIRLGPANSSYTSGAYGVVLLQSDKVLGALRLTVDEGGRQYKVDQGMDFQCRPVTGLGVASPAAGFGFPVELHLGDRTLQFALNGYGDGLKMGATL